MHLRTLTLDDLPAAARLTDAVFGDGRREARLRRYLAIEPRGWFAIEESGTLAAIGGVITYRGFGWLGLMAVRPDRQRRGLGRTVATAAIDWARGQGCATLCLIATPAGLPMYERLGFVHDGVSQELSGTPAPARGPRFPLDCVVRPWTAADSSEVSAFDAPGFGANRSRVLTTYATEFAGSSWVARDGTGAVRGFLVVQDDRLGPWTATDDGVAEQLLDVALAGVRRPLRSGIVEPAAEALLVARGFDRTRALARMRLGPAVRVVPPPRVLAHASYAVG